METNATYKILSPVDALWTLYMSQSKRVRKEFLSRAKEEEENAEEKRRMEVYEQTLTAEERDAAYGLVGAVKRGVADVQAAHESGEPVGRPAEDLLKELMEEI